MTNLAADPQSRKQQRLELIGQDLLSALDLDPTEERFLDTPARWARWWIEFMEYDPGTLDTKFATEQIDQMVILKDIRVWSLCEHHLLPFWCDVSIGYLTNGKMLGISKLARMAHAIAHTPQTQEHLVAQIARAIAEAAESEHVAVVAKGTHLCMAMRGIKSDAEMICSEMRGVFLTDPDARREFFSLTK